MKPTIVTEENELPRKLVMMGGHIIDKETGLTPIFDVEDGTEVNVLEHGFAWRATRALRQNIEIRKTLNS